MEDSYVSDPESQVVVETEAEGLMAWELEEILELERPVTRMKLIPVLPADLPGTKLCSWQVLQYILRVRYQ